MRKNGTRLPQQFGGLPVDQEDRAGRDVWIAKHRPPEGCSRERAANEVERRIEVLLVSFEFVDVNRETVVRGRYDPLVPDALDRHER